MAKTAALLVDEILPRQPLRQWVLSVPYPLRFLFASRPDVMSRVLAIGAQLTVLFFLPSFLPAGNGNKLVSL